MKNTEFLENVDKYIEKEQKIRITFIDGQIEEGIVREYTSAADNEPDGESIYIGGMECYIDEIESIDLI